jgi:hypothetical protein
MRYTCVRLYCNLASSLASGGRCKIEPYRRIRRQRVLFAEEFLEVFCVYLLQVRKRAQHSVLLTEENFDQNLERTWRSAHARRNLARNPFNFEFAIYCDKAGVSVRRRPRESQTGPGNQVRRADPKRKH